MADNDTPAYIIEASPGVGEPPANAIPARVYGALAAEVPGVQPVAVTNSTLPEGAATEAGLTALRNAIQARSYPEAITGFSTSSKQDAILVAIDALAQLLGGTLSVRPDGDFTVTVDQSGTEDVLEDIAIALGGTLTVTTEGPLEVTLPGGSTAAAQATQLTALQGILTALQAPLSVTGTVGVSGTVNVATHAVTQSGTWQVMSTPNVSPTSAALTPYRNPSTTNTPVQVKGSAGRIYQYQLVNMGNAFAFVHIYNALAANVTPGTTVPAYTWAIPPGSTLDGYWNISHNWSTAITINASLNMDGSGTPSGVVATMLGFA